MKNLKITLLVILLCVMQGFSQIYVSSTGNDTTGTGSATSPYKTIVQGINATASGGTVYVIPGSYPVTGPIFVGKPLTIKKSGSGTVFINASGWTSSDTYVLGIVNTSNVTIDGLTIANKIGNGSKGIWVLSNAGATANLNNITIKNCKVKNIGWISNDLAAIPANSGIVANAIKVDGGNGTRAITNVTIQNNKVHNCATGWGEAITLTGNVNGFTVTKNKVYDIANIGIVAAGNYTSTGATSNNQARNGSISENEVFDCMSAIANSAGIYLDGALHCIIERNEVYYCGVGISVGAEQNTTTGNGGPATGHNINNNSVYNNVITGAIFGGVVGSGYTTSLDNTTIYNNTFYKNRTGAIINGVTTVGGVSVSTIANNFGGEVHLQNNTGVTFKNNILYATTNKKALLASSGYTVTNFVSNYNLFYREGSTDFIIDLTGLSFNGSSITGSYNAIQFAAATGQDVNSVVGVPGFTDASIFDFGLITGAFAADKGDPSYSADNSGTLDFDGGLRKRNGRVDIGNSEEQIGSTKAAISDLKNGILTTYTPYPNPASEVINIEFGKNIQSAIITIMDLRGRIVSKQEFNNATVAKIDIADVNMRSQMVLLKINADNKISHHKIYVK